MRIDLVEKLDFVCPVCTWAGGAPAPLELTVESEAGGDVRSGHFRCPVCPRRYPILDGVAVLDPEPLRSTYDRPDFLQAYLWTHYADLAARPLDDPPQPQGDYFHHLALQPVEGMVLDLGCNVGRTTFDLAGHADFVLGIERSFEAVKRAREIHLSKRVAFHLKDEGDRGRYVDLDASPVVRDNVEFICGDAAALPLDVKAADVILAANLIDRLRDPRHFLARVDRVLRPQGRLMLSAPFSWRENLTDRTRWLGDASFSGPEALLAWCGEQGYEVEESAELSLTIRNHRRFYELMRPFFLRARKRD